MAWADAPLPPMSYARTFGPAGDPVTHLGWGLAAVSVAVVLIITILLLRAVLRRQAPASSTGALSVRTDSGGMNWIYVGVSVSTVVLVACAVWSLLTIGAVAMPVAAQNLTLHVTASQWWWSVRYDDADPSQTFTTANEIHIPVGRPVRVELESTDVIHSFWIPQLAGKMDVIPGLTNVTWLEADRPGVYRGQCGEYCGAQHAHMAMYVVADPPKAWKAWRAGQLQQAVEPVSASLEHGRQLFVEHCAACHTVRGGGAGGIVGPDLTHVMSRSTLAAGNIPNTTGAMAAWIANPQAIKPGCRMPAQTLAGPELDAVVAYLRSLH